jgi:hypothetical protein
MQIFPAGKDKINFVANLIKDIEIPVELEQCELDIFHEAGHAAAAILTGRMILGYSLCEGKCFWWSEFAGDSKKRSLDKFEGIVYWDAKGLSSDDPTIKMIASGGLAGELLRFGDIKSSDTQQSIDRKNGGFNDITSYQNYSDKVSGLFKSNSDIFKIVVNRMCNNKGFDDYNQIIQSGGDYKEWLKIISTSTE